MSKVAVLLADGFEEIEAIAIIDVLRRAEVEVDVIGVDKLDVTGAHRLGVRADLVLGKQHGLYEMLILPGGLPGAHTLRDHSGVQALIVEHHKAGKWLAAICAAPIAFGKAHVLEGKKATCYPSFESELTGATHVTDAVVQDGKVITSRGPGTAFEFALHLAEILRGKQIAVDVRKGMLLA